MKITDVEITNFMTLSKASLNLDNKGLVLIQGVNNDETSASSNGSGKSSIPDALCWALYGKTARGVTGDDVVNNKAKKNCLVEVNVVDGDDNYKIMRARKHSTLKNTLVVMKDGVDISKGTDKETQKVVEQIIGCSAEVFTASVYAGQEQMPNLPGMTDKILKTLVEEAAGIDRIETAYSAAKEQVREIERDANDIHSQLQSAQLKKKWAREALDSSIEEEKTWEEEHNRRLERQKKLIFDLRDKLDTMLCPTDTAIEKMDAKIEGLRVQLHGREREERQIKDLEAEANRIRIGLAQAESEATHKKDKATRLKHSLDNLSARIGTKCGECGKEYTADDLHDAEEATKKQLLAEVEEAKRLKANAEKIRRSYESALETISAAEAALTNVNDVLDGIELTERLRATATQEQRDFFALKKEIVREADKYKELKGEENPYRARININRIQFSAAEEDVYEIQARLDEIQTRLDDAKLVVEVFGPAGVRAHILDTVTPFLNDRTAHYIGTLSDGNISAIWSTIGYTAKGEMREKFNIAVENATGAKSFAGQSGGEKRKVRLATAMALQDLVSSRATKPIDLFIADEVDDALDASGLERLMGILEEKSRDRGTVLVISHNELDSYIRNVATVVKSGGVSTVEWV